MMKRAIVYVNSDHEDFKYLKEAERSAIQFRRYLPNADYLLFTNNTTYESDAFDRVVEADFTIPEPLRDRVHLNGQMVAKLNALANLDYEQVIYMGSDIYPLNEKCGELFDVLDRFDIAAAHALTRVHRRHSDKRLATIPAMFPEFNCDLVIYRNNEQVREFLREWRDCYVTDAITHAHDQGAIRYLLYMSDLRVATLPPEYNYRSRLFATDTVILQRREALKTFLRLNGQDSAFVRAMNAFFAKIGLPYRLSDFVRAMG